MYTVLLAIGSEIDQSVRSAEAVTELPEADTEVDVTALNVFEEFEARGGDGGSISSDDLYEDTDIPESLERAVEYLEERGVSTTAQRAHGDPATEIIEAAKEIDANAIVMGGRRRSPVGKALFGSVVQAVLLDARRPVFVIMSK